MRLLPSGLPFLVSSPHISDVAPETWLLVLTLLVWATGTLAISLTLTCHLIINVHGLALSMRQVPHPMAQQQVNSGRLRSMLWKAQAVCLYTHSLSSSMELCHMRSVSIATCDDTKIIYIILPAEAGKQRCLKQTSHPISQPFTLAKSPGPVNEQRWWITYRNFILIPLF